MAWRERDIFWGRLSVIKKMDHNCCCLMLCSQRYHWYKEGYADVWVTISLVMISTEKWAQILWICTNSLGVCHRVLVVDPFKISHPCVFCKNIIWLQQVMCCSHFLCTCKRTWAKKEVFQWCGGFSLTPIGITVKKKSWRTVQSCVWYAKLLVEVLRDHGCCKLQNCSVNAILDLDFHFQIFWTALQFWSRGITRNFYITLKLT